jgi:hypothetical protein
LTYWTLSCCAIVSQICSSLAAELAAALLLLLERDPQLVLRDRLMRDEHFAEADLFRASHCKTPHESGGGHYPPIRRAALFRPARSDYHAR